MKRPVQMTQAVAARQAQRKTQYLAMVNMTPTQQANLWLNKVITNTPTTAMYSTTSATTNTLTIPTTGTVFTNGTNLVWYGGDDFQSDYIDDGTITVKDGIAKTINLPDGTVIDVAIDGSFTINDKDAKVTYRANRVHDFNPFLNASDKLEGFIKFCGEHGVHQQEMLDIPIKLFIGWLIMEAAIADKEPAPEQTLLEDLKKRVKPRCRCGRFLVRKLAERNIMFCRSVCLEKELKEVAR